MPKFRKKPVVIDAVQFTGKRPWPDGLMFRCWPDDGGKSYISDDTILGRHKAIIQTLEGEMTVSDGDWIIRGVKGEFYPCKPDIFAATYSPEPSPSPENEERAVDDTKRGIYRKFDIARTDGSSEKGGKHANCAYFVLDLQHDKFALPALEAYALACHREFPDLAQDIKRIVRDADPNWMASDLIQGKE